MKKIIIVNFTFPPQSGIGGRRWAKFAKYFKKEGAEFKVITAHPIDHSSEWLFDISEYNEHILYVESGFPKVLRTQPRTLLDKVLYRFEAFRLRLLTDGNFYDHSQFWAKRLLPEIEKLISEGYNTLVASAGPFHYLYELTILKEKYGNQLHLIADFRDPWSTNKTSFGYSELSAPRLKLEQDKERHVIRTFDRVVCVAQEMGDYFMTLCPKDKQEAKFHTIMNGFDPEELPETEAAPASSTVKFVFMGTLYGKTQSSLEAFARAISAVNPQEMEFHFYGDRTNDANQVLDRLPQAYLHSKLKLKDAHTVLAQADVAMLFVTDDLTYSFSTKFCEYVAQKKPIWIISQFGKTPQFITENRIGFHSLPNTKNIEQFLNEINDHESSVLLSVNYDRFDSSAFNVQFLSKKYLELIRSLMHI